MLIWYVVVYMSMLTSGNIKQNSNNGYVLYSNEVVLILSNLRSSLTKSSNTNKRAINVLYWVSSKIYTWEASFFSRPNLRHCLSNCLFNLDYKITQIIYHIIIKMCSGIFKKFNICFRFILFLIYCCLFLYVCHTFL